VVLSPLHGSNSLFGSLSINVGLHIIDLEVVGEIVGAQEVFKGLPILRRYH